LGRKLTVDASLCLLRQLARLLQLLLYSLARNPLQHRKAHGVNTIVIDTKNAHHFRVSSRAADGQSARRDQRQWRG
jgi:hypothetical protein